MKAVQVRSITRTYPLRAGTFIWKYLLFEHWSFGTKETHFSFWLSNDFRHKIFAEHNLTWHLICCANWNLLVPWKLLQRLFYCFSCSLIGWSWIISKVQWNLCFQTFFAPYLFHHSKSNRRDKLRSKFWRQKNVQKAKIETAQMIVGLWNQQTKRKIRLCLTGQ